MKKTAAILICLILCLSIFPTAAYADAGPKPSVTVRFKGLEGERYYATLLSDYGTTGPFSVLEPGDEPRYTEKDEDNDIFWKFVDYKDADGFYFLQYYEDCSESQKLNWSYYPPETFKILLYFPESDSFVVSTGIYERYAFESYFTATFSGGHEPPLSVEKSYNFLETILSFLFRVMFTLAVELGLAWLFGFREKKLFRFIVLVNIITQLGLNIALNVINFYMGQFVFVFFYILLEFIVIIVEALLYSGYIRKRSPDGRAGCKPAAYALVANLVSFTLGVVLAFWIPSVF